MENIIVIFCTSPDKETSLKLARGLVNDKLAACVNILPGVTSVYHWENKLEQGAEELLLIKTIESKIKAVENYLLTNHPYSLPEIMGIEANFINEKYKNWVYSEIKS